MSGISGGRTSRCALVVLAVVLLASVLSWWPGASVARASTDGVTDVPAGPVRILLNGDSITRGRDGDWTWRYRLWREVQRQQVAVDLVGSGSGTHDGSLYLDPRFDRDHWARGGTWLRTQGFEIAAEVTRHRPDVVVAQLGVNDLLNSRTPKQVAGSLRAWIAAVRRAAPTATIVVVSVLPHEHGAKMTTPTAVADYNLLARQVVAELDQVDARIVFSDAARGFVAASMTFDGLHPTPSGEVHLARAVAGTLHELGLLPVAPAIAGVTRWERGLKATVRTSGRRVTVGWDPVAGTGARLDLRSGRTVAASPTRTRRGGTARLDGLVPGAPYTLRLVAVRGRMVSTPGPVTSFRAPGLGRSSRVVVGRRTVRWGSVSGATRYRVEWRQPGSRGWRVRTVTGTRVSMTASTVRVRAINPWSTGPRVVGRR